MGLSAVPEWFPIHLHKLCGCICSLVLQQWASFASKQKGLGAIALGEDQPGDANGDACVQANTEAGILHVLRHTKRQAFV